MNVPPPLPEPDRERRNMRLVVVGITLAVVPVVVFGVVLAARAIVSSGITKGPDQMLGDQHLKTSVALVELHRTRYGEYPGSLEDLKFLGSWDKIALSSVRYYPSGDRLSYYIEVSRGWIGKPSLSIPDEFWQGTGFSRALKPATE